jgi:predicted N-acyltransferase
VSYSWSQAWERNVCEYYHKWKKGQCDVPENRDGCKILKKKNIQWAKQKGEKEKEINPKSKQR